MVGFLDMINWFFEASNRALEIVLPWVLLAALVVYPVVYLIKGIRKLNKEKKGEEERISRIFRLLLGTFILLLLALAVFFIFWILPEIILRMKPTLSGLMEIFRWVVFSIAIGALAYFHGHKNGGHRWKISAAGHFLVILLGYLVQYWVGIFLISLPILAVYYCALYDLAMVVMPSSDPESPAEKRKKFLIFVSYSWGFQRPLVVVEDHAWKDPVVRIPGDNGHDLPIPGFVWMRSHQAVGIASGMKMKRIDGPGIIFTTKGEQPLQMMDLRVQIRTSEIDVVSQDGIGFKVRIVTKFRLDSEPWDQNTYDELRRMNTHLRGANKPNYTLGSFPFSHLRIQAAIGITSSNASGGGSVFWDQWVLSVVEHETRQVISQRNLEELWRPKEDEEGANALDAIATEIEGNAILRLRSRGVHLIAARVVNFTFPTKKNHLDGFSEQQLLTWGSEWERKRASILAEAQAESDRTQQEARAYAESLLLNSIAEGLQKTEKINPRLPHYVIAMRFLSALQDLLPQQTADEDAKSENDRKMAELQKSIRAWREQYSLLGREKQS